MSQRSSAPAGTASAVPTSNEGFSPAAADEYITFIRPALWSTLVSLCPDERSTHYTSFPVYCIFRFQTSNNKRTWLVTATYGSCTASTQYNFLLLFADVPDEESAICMRPLINNSGARARWGIIDSVRCPLQSTIEVEVLLYSHSARSSVILNIKCSAAHIQQDISTATSRTLESLSTPPSHQVKHQTSRPSNSLIQPAVLFAWPYPKRRYTNIYQGRDIIDTRFPSSLDAHGYPIFSDHDGDRSFTSWYRIKLITCTFYLTVFIGLEYAPRRFPSHFPQQTCHRHQDPLETFALHMIQANLNNIISNIKYIYYKQFLLLVR